MNLDQIADEVARYPLTGRFLMGRVRHVMREREKGLIESLIAQTETFDDGLAFVQRGQRLEQSTIVIEGMVGRVVPRGRGRHIVGLHVPGDFVDLHG